jgi:N-acetylmuramoyl-L-alanine amidase
MDIGRNEIDAWHRHRGFLGIGYHWVIRRNGELEVGRDEEVAGAHARGFNHNSVSIALVGGVTEGDVSVAEDNFTDEQWISLEQLVKGLMHKYPDADVVGHADLKGVTKKCPSFDVKSWLKKQL